MVTNVEKVEALLGTMTRQHVEKLPAAQRKRLAKLLRRVADMADPPRSVPKSGVLSELDKDPREG
jgi:hypothetical protein